MSENEKEESSPQETEKPKPKTFRDAFRQMHMTEEEEKELHAEQFAEASYRPRPKEEKKEKDEKDTDPPPEDAPVDESDPDAIPDWVEFPDGFRIPPHKQVVFMRFRSHWTDRPDLGDRWCMMWPLSDSEEKLALKRTRGDSARSLSEMAKQTIHLIDGKRADWSGRPAEDSYVVERFWNEIGAKCRQQIINFFVKTHQLDAAEQQDFFANCLVVCRAKVG